MNIRGFYTPHLRLLQVLIVLFTKKYHRAMDHFRRTRQTAPLELVEPALPRAAAQDAFLVLRQIRGLPEAYRETLILRLVEGMTGPEIAAHTGLTPDSVRVNLCRGMKMLRALLEAK